MLHALVVLGYAVSPHPEYPGEWITDCPGCLQERRDETLLNLWALDDGPHAGAAVLRCAQDRHDMFTLGGASYVPAVRELALYRVLDAGRAEVDRVVAALAAAGHNPHRGTDDLEWAAYRHQARCPACHAANPAATIKCDIYLEHYAEEPLGEDWGRLRAVCDNDPCHGTVDILAALGVITDQVLRERYNQITDWAAPDDTGPQWLIEPIMERGQFAAIYGRRAVGKSLLALDLASAAAEAGHTVLYLDMENQPQEIRGRLAAMGRQPDPARLRYLPFPQLPGLDTEAGAAALQALADHVEPDLIVLDTWSKFIAGDESNPSTHTRAYQNAIVPLRRRGTAVLALDHTGKDVARGPRGGSSKGDNVDLEWLLTAKGPGRLRLERTKSRTGRGPDVVELDRLSGPLRHAPAGRADVSTTAVLDPKVRALVDKLDEMEVPTGWGRDKVAAALRANGCPARTDTLADALRVRRDRAVALTGDLDLSHDLGDRLGQAPSDQLGQVMGQVAN